MWLLNKFSATLTMNRRTITRNVLKVFILIFFLMNLINADEKAAIVPREISNQPLQENSIKSSSSSSSSSLSSSQQHQLQKNQQRQQQEELSVTLIPTEEKRIPEHLKYCVHVERDLCYPQLSTKNDKDDIKNETDENKALRFTSILNLSKRDTRSCHCQLHPKFINTWFCCNITHMTMISSCSGYRNWTNLHVYNMTIKELNLSEFSSNSLQSLSITDGAIKRMNNSFPKLSSIKCLNISNNNLSFIPQRALKNSPNLIYLDLSDNNLSRIPNWNQNQNIAVDVEGNKYMLCDNLTEAIFSDSFQFVKPNTSLCRYNSSYSWFHSTDYISIQQLKMSKQFLTKCPVIPGYGNCTCKRDHAFIIQDEQSKSICHVDCSNLGLIELPATLPDNTFSLNISNNLITSFGNHFNTNPSYQSIVKLIADNNRIDTINDLEGTKFLDHFQRLYLRNNLLTKLPEYFLTNALVDRDIGGRIFLAGNKLQCDCNSAKTLKFWLLERSNDIPDYNEILCRNLPSAVVDLQENKLCQSPHDWTDYIYYLIASEVLLLVLLITKVSYDYWVFKTAGYLPWPASRMPKMPCDWLCE